MGPRKTLNMKRAPIKRALKGQTDRTAASRLAYQTGYKLPAAHGFLLTFADRVDTSEIHDASLKLTSLESEGLNPVSLCVLSQCHGPEDRVVHMEGCVHNLNTPTPESAWSQLCDWVAVWTAAREQVLSLAQLFHM